MIKIPLTNSNEYALIDAEDYEKVSEHRWSIDKGGYPRSNSIRPTVYLHKLVRPDIEKIDHKDRNKLNCQKENLRPCTRSQNTANSRLYTSNSSGYRGVSWYKSTRRWLAYITVNQKRICLGYFDDKIDAIKAYNEAAKRYFGEFAYQNKLEEKNDTSTYIIHQ